MRDFCSALSCVTDNSFILLDSSLIFENVSMIDIVASIACELLSMVAINEQPFFGKCFGIYRGVLKLSEPVEIFHQFIFLKL